MDNKRLFKATIFLVIFLSGCTYTSANIIKLRGDEIRGHFASSPINITGKNVVLTIYREMVLSWNHIRHSFAKTVEIENEREKGDIKITK